MDNWNDTKDKIINALKFGLLTSMMIIGFFFCYTFIVYLTGTAITNLVLWVIFAAAVISEVFYIKWISN